MTKAIKLREEAAQLASDAGSTMSGVASTLNPCETRRTIRFSLADSASIETGDKVEVRLATVPEVVAHGVVIGTVSGRDGNLMRGCLTSGYELTGVMRQLDRSQMSGMAEVSGNRPSQPLEEENVRAR